MPRLAPEKRGAGLQAPRPDTGLPPLPIPDQSRYGPVVPREPGAVGIAYTAEGGGTVATCRVCGWLRWSETDAEAERHGRAHACLSESRCFVCGPPRRLKDEACPHYTPTPKKEPTS